MKKQTTLPQPATSRGESGRSVPVSKSEKLRRIRARQDAIWQQMRAANLPFLSDSPLQKQWGRLLEQGNRLEETFVTYQGQDFDASRCACLSGDISFRPGFYWEDIDERIYRDGTGRYYLWRRLERKGPTRVHRITVKAAALWAVTRANPDTNHLRRDVAALVRKEAN